MASPFIPEFHLIPSSEKINPEWCKKAIDYYWYNSNIKSLLWDKKIAQIEEFFTGDIKMDRFMTMFKSMKKKHQEKMKTTGKYLIGEHDFEIEDLIFEPYPLIQNKINAAIALIQKIPVEITCTANDALAMKKRKEDIEFLKNKPALEADMQDLADQMQIGKVDLGTTKHSSVKFGDNPFGLDLSDPEDEKTFTALIYALNVETALEQALEQFKEIKNDSQIKLLNTKDQFKYAVSVNRAFRSDMTGLPDAEYIWPGDMYVPYSQLPDYSDNSSRFWEHKMTVTEMFNFLGSEICDQEQLDNILNGAGGYSEVNNIGRFDENNWNTQKVNLVYCEVKSVDWVGIYSNPKSKKGFASLTYDINCKEKIWGQNTYCFWWIKNTNYFYKIEILDFAHRGKGVESYQNFSTNIYKSNHKSAVELSIGQNIKAQIAEIKINFAVLMAKADGFYIDIRGMRNAAESLKDTNYSTQNLLQLFFEKNIIIADTQGFEGKNDGQFKPIVPIEGGIKNILNYLQIQQTADQKINQITGINDSLTGVSQNPDALIGVEKLRIDASINALYYVTEAIQSMQQKMYNIWGNTIQYSIKEGGAVKKAMVNYLGIDDVNLLEGLDETPLHNLTLKVTLTQREQERLNYQQNLNFLKAQNAITIADEYILSAITNPKKRFAELARIENRYKKQRQAEAEQRFQENQQLQQQRNEGLLATENAATEGEIKKVYAKGEVDAKIATLAHELGIKDSQIQFMIKRSLQQDRGQDQYRKALDTIQQKQQSKLLEPLTIS